jgi:hypothetical protein
VSKVELFARKKPNERHWHAYDVLLGTFQGRRLCHVRTFLKRLDGIDYDPPLPTKKGVTVTADKVPELIAALTEVCRIEGIANAV